MQKILFVLFVAYSNCLRIRKPTTEIDCGQSHEHTPIKIIKVSKNPVKHQQPERERTERERTERERTERERAERERTERERAERERAERERTERAERTEREGVSSIATFYFRTGPNVDGCPAVQSFDDGASYGPCRNEAGTIGVKYTSASKYWAAIANAGSRCGDTITVTYMGNSLDLTVMDECIACHQDNHVDMSLDALIELTGSKESACAIGKPLPQITWK